MSPLAGVPNDALLHRLRALLTRESALEAELLVHLGEVDARRLFLPAGFSSMFRYCVEILHLAEGVAYKRIAVARAARRHPALLAALRAGQLHLTAASLLAPHLDEHNAQGWIDAARHRSAEDVRRLIADHHPKPDVATSVRPVAAACAEPAAIPVTEALSGGTAPRPTRPDVPGRAPHPAEVLPSRPIPLPEHPRTEPLGAARFAVHFTADEDCHQQLQELRALLRHQVPDGDIGKILARAVGELLVKVRKQRLAEVERPRKRQAEGEPEQGQERDPAPDGAVISRHIPAAVRRAVRRAVVARDGGSCAFVAQDGRRCQETGFLEFHHVKPWARNRRHDPDEISLRCRAHNDYHARRDFGERHMRRYSTDSAGGTPAVQLDSNPVDLAR